MNRFFAITLAGAVTGFLSYYPTDAVYAQTAECTDGRTSNSAKTFKARAAIMEAPLSGMTKG
jgi:hypothetical protein